MLPDDPIIGGRRLSELVAEGMVDPRQAKLTPTAPPLSLSRWRPPAVPLTWPLTIELPLPPTTNNLFINSRGGGRVLSVRYRDWKPLAAARLKHLPPVTEYPVAITYRIIWGKGWRANWDVSNREKAATDALVEAGVLQGDSCLYVCRTVSEIVDPGNRKLPVRFAVIIERAEMRRAAA
jgi:Holliday junction resolvase RusA-like endonuclease